MRNAIGIVVALLTSIASGALAQPPANVVLDEVTMQDLERMRRVTGELRAYQRSRLAAREQGLVLELDVRAGDDVTKGQVIARLDSVLAQLTVASAEASVAALKATVAEREAELERAKLDYERYESLLNQASASSQEFDDARVDLASAQARLLSAEADVAAAEARLALDKQRVEDMVIRAPFDAKVVSTSTDVGEWIGEGDQVVELYSVASIEAWVDVPEASVERMAGVGSIVMVHIPAMGGEVQGTVRQIVPEVDPLSRLFPVRISVPNVSGLLKPGMSVTAMIPTGQRTQMLTVSKDAILRDDAGEFVYMAVPNEMPQVPFDQVAAPMRITREFAVGDRVAIRRGGLQPGMQLVVEGNERMFPMQPLIDVSATAHTGSKEEQADEEPTEETLQGG